MVQNVLDNTVEFFLQLIYFFKFYFIIRTVTNYNTIGKAIQLSLH